MATWETSTVTIDTVEGVNESHTSASPPMCVEQFSSRVNSVVGILTSGLRRVFRVSLHDAMDDPIAVLQYRHNGDGVPFGSAHPWDSTAVASQYTICERVSPRMYMVEVLYTILPSKQGWFRWVYVLKVAAFVAACAAWWAFCSLV